MEAASTQRKNLVRSLDPRMKLLLVVVISTATMFTPSREVVAWNYIIIILLWLISGEVRHAIKFALIFAMVLVVEYASLWIPNDTLKMMVSFLLFIVARSLSMVSSHKTRLFRMAGNAIIHGWPGKSSAGAAAMRWLV